LGADAVGSLHGGQAQQVDWDSEFGKLHGCCEPC
jgi:hypothetical protein